MSRGNRNYKASVFSHLFGTPQCELELYNAVSPVQYPPDTPVTDLTLTDVLYMDRVNDLSFSVGDKLVIFFEQQSTINENMALRYLMYCARVYEKLIDNKEMYSAQRIVIPTPEFYVLYNGKAPFPEKQEYRLSESFAHANAARAALELTVTAYNVNPGFNKDIVERSKNLYGYMFFVAKVREHEKSGLKLANAIEIAIKECIALGILVDYLGSHGSEVTNMLLQEWNWEDARSVWERDAEARSDRKWQAVIADKDMLIADRDTLIADKDMLIAELQAKLNEKEPLSD